MPEISNKRQILIATLIGSLIPISIYGLLYVGNLNNFRYNIHGKKICQQIADELNKIQATTYYVKGDTIIGAADRAEQINAFDSEYSYSTPNKHICKVWVKAENSSNRPFIRMEGAFTLRDKHSAALSHTIQKINSTIYKNETVLLVFEYGNDFKEAHNVSLGYNELFIPLQGIEYCIVQDRLLREATEIYKYEYNKVLSCNCGPGYGIYSSKKCDIFYNSKIRKNCLLLSEVVPYCNKWIQEVDPVWYEQNKKKNTPKDTSSNTNIIQEMLKKKTANKRSKNKI